jgi:hypothetical protein
LIERLRLRLFSGKLQASFATTRRLDFVAQVDNPRAAWVRILVENCKKNSIARGCRGYLTALNWGDVSGELQHMPIGDSLPLIWSNTDGKTLVDIPHGVKQFLDIFAVFEDQQHTMYPQTAPSRLSIPWRNEITIHFEVIIVADARSPIKQCGRILKNSASAWNDVSVSPHNTCSST